MAATTAEVPQTQQRQSDSAVEECAGLFGSLTLRSGGGAAAAADRCRSLHAAAAAHAPSAVRLDAPPPPPPSAATARLVVFDLETTGVTPDSRVVEFGAVVVEDLRTLVPARRVQIYVRVPSATWQTGDAAAASRVTGITESSLAGKPEFAAVADEIFAVMDGAVWVGYNILRFDVGKLEREFALIGRAAPVSAGVLDVYCVAAAWRLDELAGNLKLDTLCKWYGLGDERHEALDDAEKTLAVLERVIATRYVGSLVEAPVSSPSGAHRGAVSPPPPTKPPRPDPAPLPPSASAPTPSSLAQCVAAAVADPARRIVCHRDRLPERAAVTAEPKTWPAGCLVGGDNAAALLKLASSLSAIQSAIPYEDDPNHVAQSLAVRAGYQKADKSCYEYLLVPRDVSKPTQVEAVNLLETGAGANVVKTFLYRRFLWTQPAIIVVDKKTT